MTYSDELKSVKVIAFLNDEEEGQFSLQSLVSVHFTFLFFVRSSRYLPSSFDCNGDFFGRLECSYGTLR